MPARKAQLDLIPINDAAAHVRYHHRTVRRWIAQGKLQGYRIAGWGLRVDRNELDALVRPVANGQGR